MDDSNDRIKGRGAQINTQNPFLKHQIVSDHIEGIDEEYEVDGRTHFFLDHPKTIVNKVKSPDIPLEYSLNPYQGCEHGCVYCYARNSHQYWNWNAGVDFERKIIVKENAAELLAQTFEKKSWVPDVIMLSGNTDCYQPIERQKKITRAILQTCLEYKNPVGIITKNQLVLRDIDILKPLAQLGLVHVNISITTLDESIRQLLEPRTVTSYARLKTVEKLTSEEIPVNVMVAPIIPGLNSDELPAIVKASADAGALSAYYTMVRLNGAVETIFVDWVLKTFPDRANKILHQIAECHGGTLSDSRFGQRMVGQGKIAETIRQLFMLAHKKHIGARRMPTLRKDLFERKGNGQLKLF